MLERFGDCPRKRNKEADNILLWELVGNLVIGLGFGSLDQAFMTFMCPTLALLFVGAKCLRYGLTNGLVTILTVGLGFGLASWLVWSIATFGLAGTLLAGLPIGLIGSAGMMSVDHLISRRLWSKEHELLKA